jgi:hypothetical protein
MGGVRLHPDILSVIEAPRQDRTKDDRLKSGDSRILRKTGSPREADTDAKARRPQEAGA